MKTNIATILLFMLSISSLAQSNLTVAENTFFVSTGDAHVSAVNSNILNEGNIEMTAGNLHLSGNKELLIGGNGTTALYNLSISNTKKSYYLENDLSVANRLEMREGVFDLDNFYLYLGELNGHITGESESSYISSSGQGEIVKYLMLSNPENLEPGNLGITLSANHNFGYTEIRRGHEQQQLPSGNGIARYYYITPESFPSSTVQVGVAFLMHEWYGSPDQQFQLWTKDSNAWEALSIQNEKYTPGKHYNINSTTENPFLWVTVGAEEPFEETLDEVPTAFTPNGDGKNDTFIIPWIYKYPTAIVMIFNRWGDKLYTTNDYGNNPWDGTYKGKTLAPNSFYYTISFPDKKKGSLKGNISIVK